MISWNLLHNQFIILYIHARKYMQQRRRWVVPTELPTNLSHNATVSTLMALVLSKLNSVNYFQRTLWVTVWTQNQGSETMIWIYFVNSLEIVSFLFAKSAHHARFRIVKRFVLNISDLCQIRCHLTSAKMADGHVLRFFKNHWSHHLVTGPRSSSTKTMSIPYFHRPSKLVLSSQENPTRGFSKKNVEIYRMKYRLPSREPKYPIPRHFWRWFSFSHGGICWFPGG